MKHRAHMLSSMLAAASLAALLAGCEATRTCGEPPVPGAQEVWLIDSLQFGRIESNISEGFDLDDLIGMQCARRDYTDPDGLRGIDNALAGLLPVVEAQAVGGQHLDYLLEDSIAAGQILLAFELAGVDDERDDGCFGVRMRRLSGEPLLGTDNLLLGGQTLYPDTSAPISELGAAEMLAGRLETEPADIVLPISILDARFTLNLLGGRVRITRVSEDRIEGVIAGGIDIEEIFAVVATLNIPSDLMATAEALIRTNADLALIDGACSQLSAVLVFTAVPGFIAE